MSVYKMSEIVGTSKESFADATRVAVERASKTLRNLSWFEVKEQRGTVKDGQVAEFQVKLAVGFRLDD
ncbi:MAG: dodecin domain-containing protein [Proteobacteria bacterium]|nr:dodecin domain-containing protein [Pseudomonadota bacterium]